MAASPTRTYEFGIFRLDPVRRVLYRHDRPVQATTRALDILVTLIERRGQVVSKDDLLRLVWPDSIVHEANLTQNVFVLRKLLGERPSDRQFLLTVPGRGYRFVADVREIGDAPQPAPADAPLTATVASPQIRTLAVLPFHTVDCVGADEHLGLGLADALITRLSGLDPIAVRPTTSMLRHATAGRDPFEVGRRLGVDALVLGTVQRSGDRIRVSVQLVTVADEAMRWARRFDERLTDLFTVESSIAEQVKGALPLALTRRAPGASAASASTAAVPHTPAPEAYRAYLRGRYCWNKRTKEGFFRAIDYFEAAIAADPKFALAYAGIADCRNFLSIYSAVPPNAGYPKAAIAATQALELDETLAEAHTSLAYAMLNYRWDFATAEQGFRRALALSPNYVTAHHLYADLLTATGRFAEARAAITRAQELDPVSLIINTDIGWTLYHARRYDEAVQQLEETLELDPTFWYTYWVLGLNLEQLARYADAMNAFEQARALNPNSPYAVGAIGRIHAAAGRPAEARRALEEVTRISVSRYVSPWVIATIHATLGDRDRAFEWLDWTFDEHSHWLMYVGNAPLLDSLRSDPRFPLLAERVRQRSESGAPDGVFATRRP